MRAFIRLVLAVFALCAGMSLSSHAATAKPIRITGRVVDYRAQPVDGASIMLYSQSLEAPSAGQALTKLAETKSAADGRFDLAVERDEPTSPSMRWLIAYQDGLALCWTTQALGLRPAVLRLGQPKPLGGLITDEAGRPVAGAGVKLYVKNELMEPEELPLPGPEEWHTRQTDKEGRFLFDNLPADTTADFQVEAPGRARIWTFCDFGPKEGEQFPVGRTDIHIRLPPEARIAGTVIDEDTGRPVSGVRVLARPQQRAGAKCCYGTATVDPNGRFVLTALAPGAYLLDVVAPEGQSQDWFGANPMVMVRAGERTRDLRLAVNRGATLEVVVREANSEAGIGGLQIHLSCGHYKCTRTTDANGLVRLHVPPGQCTLSGYKEDYGGFPDHAVQLEKGQTRREEMRLAYRAVQVSGTVCDQSGHALAGSAIAHWPFWPVSLTDANGHFEYTYGTTGPGSAQMVFARHEPSGLANIVELQDPSQSRRLRGRITLKPAYTLVGRVVDPNGAGIPAASVRLVVGSPQRGPRRISTLAELLTDAHGAYQIRAVPMPPADFDAHYYAVVAHAPGYNETSVDPVNLKEPPEQPIDLGTLLLQPADQVVAGTVVDANDRPVAGALVETPRLRPCERYSAHEDATQLHRQVFTDARGRFRLAGICRGPVELAAYAAPPGRQEGVTYTSAGEKTVRIILGQTLSFARSLAGARMPSLADFGLREPSAGLEGKAVLLCFLDVQQRPSRHVLSQLAERAGELTKNNVAFVAVQATPCATAALDKLAAQYGRDIRFGKVAENAESAQRAWGIQSLPWLVLADRDHIIRTEGFPPATLPSRLDELAGRPVP